MGTSSENSLMDFDLDLLLCPASASLSVNPKEDNLVQEVGVNVFSGHDYQTNNVVISESSDCGTHTANVGKNAFTGYQYEIQNVENNKTTAPFQTTNHKNKFQDMGNLNTTKQSFQDKNDGNLVENELIYSNQDNNDDVIKMSEYDALLADHKALRKQYARLASDYGSMSKENKKNALSSLNFSTKLENVERGNADLLIRIHAQEVIIERMKVDSLATSKQLIQYHGRVEDLESEIADLKNSMVKNKYDGKEKRTHINTIKTLTDQLCILGCVLAGKKQLSKESNRFLKKHCKNWTSYSKKNIETEIIEIQSVDTGRGSSLAFSDGERSFNNSPAYSFSFSPFSAGTPRNEQAKMTKDSCTSPSPMIKTFDISTSPIDFDQVVSSTPAIKTSDVDPNTEISHDANTVPEKKTMDTGTSPIMFADMITPEAKRKTLNVATSTIDFSDTFNVKTVDIAVSPVMFADTTTLETKIVTKNIATSPVKFASTMIPVTKTKTLDIAVSPIMFADTRTTVTEIETLNIATSPIQFADTITPVAKTKTLNVAVSPIMLADTRTTVNKTETFNIATNPIKFADTMTPVAKTKTLDNVSPIKFADTVVNSPVDYADARIPPASPMMRVNMISPVAATKTLNLPNPIEQVEAKLPTSWSMFDVPSPIECTSAKSPVPKPKSLHVTNIPNRKFLKSIAFVPSSCNTDNTEDCREKLNEIISKQLNQSQDDLENDLEISMILNKYRLDWDMLSPVSLTPEADQNHEQTQTESKVHSKQSCPTNKKETCNNHSDLTLAQSLYLSENGDSDTEFDKEDCHISDIENPEHVETTHNVFDHKKNTIINAATVGIKQNNTTSLIGNLVTELLNNDISNKDHVKLNKSHKSTSKYQKLTNLQKAVKANPPKTKVTNQSIHKLKSRLKFEECQERVKTICKEPYPNLKETLFIERIQPSTNVLDIVKPTETVCKSKETQLKNIIDTHLPTKSSAESDKIKKICFLTETLSDSTNSISHPPTKSPVKSDTNERVFISSKSSSKSKCELAEVQLNLQPQCTQSLNLPTELVTESNYSYPNPVIKRISRVKKDISTISSCVPTNQIESNQRCNTSTISPPPKRTVDDLVIRNKCDFKQKKTPSISQHNITKEQVNIGTSKTKNNKVSNNTNESEGYKKAATNTRRDTQRQDVSTVDSIIVAKSVNSRKMHIDYSDIDMFDTQDDCMSMETSQIKNNYVSNNINESEGIQSTQTQDNSNSDTIILAKAPNLRKRHADYSDINMFDSQNICKSKETEITHNSASNNVIVFEGYQPNATSCTQEGTPSQDDPNIDSIILAKSIKRRKMHADYSDINMFDTQNVCKSMETSIIANNSVNNNNNGSEGYQQNATCTQKDTPSQDDGNIDSLILSKSANDLTQKKNIKILWQESLLDRMIYKYASKPEVQMVPKGDEKIAIKINNGIKKCVKNMPKKNDYLTSVKQLVHDLKPYENQAIVFGLMTYLKDPARLTEFITANEGKKGFYGRPSTTEIALIDVFQTMKECGIDIWDRILDMSEFILFRLEHGASPCFSVLESVGHFFATVCKYRNDPSRLWLFMLNSMYCFSFKAIPLIKHCLDVAPELIPHSSTRMDTGRASMIRCFVFLLNYYTCEDRRKRIDEIRRRLKYYYNYNLQDENETTLLFFLKEAIIQLSDKKIDKLILELVFLIVAKRRGTKWSHRNIVLKILLPILDDNAAVSCTARRFCITTIGCILKPYNNDMLVHTETVVNKLIALFEQPSQPDMIKDDIVRSLMSMDIKTLWERTNTCLSNWNPPEVSPELENAMKIYINRKKIRDWKEHYSKNDEK